MAPGQPSYNPGEVVVRDGQASGPTNSGEYVFAGTLATRMT